MPRKKSTDKRVTSMRISEYTAAQIEQLEELRQATKSEIMMMAVDRMYRQDFPDRKNPMNYQQETQNMQTARQTITIKEINTRPEIDPYHRDTGGITRTCIRLDPEAREIEVYQSENSGSTLSHVWHGILREWTFPAHPKEDDMRGWLEDNMGVFERICAGHIVEWDGSNMVGKTTEDASAAIDEITHSLEYNRELDDLNYYEFWQLDDWLDPASHTAIGKTDEELRELAAEMVEAGEPHQIIWGDADEAFEILKSCRDENE